jgi:exodeoxyribonuclease-3
MRITTANVNGIRSAATKGFLDWLQYEAPDVACLQETRAPLELLEGPNGLVPRGWQAIHRVAETRGYSGVSIYSKRKPDAVIDKIGWGPFDSEARYVEARFGDLSVVSLYLPSGSSGEPRQAFKYKSMAELRPILDQWLRSGRNYVLCGDWNIVRGERDIRNWKSNQKNSGCLPDERAWLNALCADDPSDADLGIGRGWVDSYRVLNPEGRDYTWWSNRGAARANDVGWRIDFQFVSPPLRARLRSCGITREPRFSDHAPYTVEFE